MFQRIKIVDLELSQPLTDLVGLDGYGSARMLVRLHTTPIGQVELPVVAGRIAATELHRVISEELRWPLLRQHLIGLLAQTDHNWSADALLNSLPTPAYAGPWPSISVAVCTRNRPDDILVCVEALTGLDYPGELEIIVVDNAPPDDETERALQQRFGQLSHVRYVREPRPGLDWARNRAITTARHEILAYTDDDVIVDRFWARAIGQLFAENPGVMAMTGLVAPYELETEPQFLFERYGGFGKGYVQRWFHANLAGGERAATNYAGTGQFGTGANMAYRLAIFDQIGQFDPALDVGTITNGGGDLEMYFRVIKAGHPIVYEPRALVRHRHRRDQKRFQEQIANNGVGLYAYLARSFLNFPDERLAILRLGLWWFWYWYVRSFILSFIRPHEVFRSRQLVLAEVRGVMVGLRCYPQARINARKLSQPFDETIDQLRVSNQTRPGLRTRASAVRTIELNEPLVPITDVTDYPNVNLIIQRDGIPIGSFSLPNRYLPLSLERIRMAIVDYLYLDLLVPRVGQPSAQAVEEANRILSEHYAPSVAKPNAIGASTQRISVVVATLDRPDDLRACLQSLVAHTDPNQTELIVVDNNPSSGQTPPVVADFPTVILVSETRRGLSYARNRGVTASTGDIVVMTDDDVIVVPDWLEQLVAPFARPDVMIVTGNVLPLQLETRAQHLFERYGGLGRGFERREFSTAWLRSFRFTAAPTWNLGATANAAFRASIFYHPEIGLLDESLGPGTPTGCGEDTYLFYKVLKAGYTIVYEPRSYLWHRHRRDMESLRRQIYNYSRGHIGYHLTTLVNDGDVRVVPYLLFQLPRFHVRALLHHAKQKFRGRPDYSLWLTLNEIVGNLAGTRGYFRSLKRVAELGRSDPYIPPAQRSSLGTDSVPLRQPTVIDAQDSPVVSDKTPV
ncbi:MAG: glycosyltransferase [Oscillochloridaceae bacterium umkhey_bin13]